MIELQFTELEAGIVSRPRSSSHGVELRLGSLCLRDRLTAGTLFPVLVGPPGARELRQGVGLSPIGFHANVPRGQRCRQNYSIRTPGSGGKSTPNPDDEGGPLFSLLYEAVGSGVRRLHVRSRPIDVVYQPAVARWLVEFACAPHQRSAARHRLEEMRARTKQQLTDTWGSMLDGHQHHERTTWDLRFDVSAPQLILVERFCDPTAAIAVVDLGTLHLENGQQQLTPQHVTKKQSLDDEEEDDDAFMTPCSTPPGSETGEDIIQNGGTINELTLHQKLYDTYNLELSDIQVLVGRVRDNWRHAHTKGSSSLHVLDRFNIKLRVERRVVPTSDPMYPSVTLAANLPRLVAHVNEQKISALRTLARVISDTSLPSPFNTASPAHHEPSMVPCSITPQSEDFTTTSETEPYRLLTIQFTVDQMSLEVQSRGRSVAELQVSGVTASLHRRPFDLSISLTVHGLLLVDALQTFGPDFELLVASHRHVGMDSMSGSLRDSEPTSPISPGSPDPGLFVGRATSPIALTKALSAVVSPLPDNEALISVEFVIITGHDKIQVATIQFNNLDIIANQETIVELVGFIRRVNPDTPPPLPKFNDETFKNIESTSPIDVELRTRTELTFDFHRLNVLLLRGTIEEGRSTGRKIGTATMCEARIQATVDSDLFVRGSLGGLQVLDLTPEGHLHQRIVSVGRDPLADATEFNFKPELLDHHQTAFSFSVRRNLHNLEELDEGPVDVSIRMASVWYTHSPQFLSELRSCATEFKQYLADVARSIRSAATDVALGLVHARTEALAHYLYDVQSPRRLRRRSTSTSTSEPHTPFTPFYEDDADDTTFGETDVQLDIVLDSPVLVLPRSAESSHVLVGHLGKISVNNQTYVENQRTYTVEIRDMSISTLDTSGRRVLFQMVPRADQLYGCDDPNIALPILHDTLVRLQVTKYTTIPDSQYNGGLLDVSGCVVNALRVSLTRAQYEQVLDTMQWLGKDDGQTQQSGGQIINGINIVGQGPLTEITEEDVVGGVSTLSMDPHVRAKLFPSASRRARINPNPSTANTNDPQDMRLSIRFEVASFEVELCGEDGAGLIGLSFGDFLLTLHTPKMYETDLEVTLRSLLVEDLLADKGTLGRRMISSREEADIKITAPVCVSRSCPLDVNQAHCRASHYGSLPDRLDTKKMYGIIEPTPVINRVQYQTNEKNLVTVTCKIIDASCPDFDSHYESMKKSSVVDLGAIDVVVSARSWLPLLDFFSFTNDNNNLDSNISETKLIDEPRLGNSTTCVTIRSLTLQALCASSLEHSLARARVTDIRINSLREGDCRRISGRLGALHVRHSTPGKHACFAERFVTIGNQALDFKYESPPSSKDQELCSELTMQISPFVYVHTKRFVTEVRAFFAEFQRPKNIVKKTTTTSIARMSLKLSADACVMLIPIHPGCSDLLVLDVGQLTVSNLFEGCFDIQTWKLHDVDVYAAEAHPRDILTMNTQNEPTLVFGDCAVLRRGGSLLTEKCLLEIRIDKNLMPDVPQRKNGVADMTMHCCLSTLDCTLDVHDYALIRGVLSHNLGEDTEHILPSVTSLETTQNPDDVWTLSSLRIELLDVRVRLRPLACVNFVRSRLTVDSFSDLSQDIDLVSRQILIIDERQNTSNVFTEVLRPARNHPNKNDGSVQAEIHSRRRRDKSKFTVLLNNMRLMAIPDWWKSASDFIFTLHQFDPAQQDIDFDPYRSHQQQETQRIEQQNEVPYELKLNITDSEIVVVEDTGRPDTNAVILRSTTLLTYRPGILTSPENETLKPLSFSVNHLELFSCRFRETERDADEDTALSIVDPVTVTADLTGTTLDVQLHELTIRVSYRDMLMFAAMLESIRRQTAATSVSKSVDEDVSKLCALGFSGSDCITALSNSNGRLDDAALWLTQNATPKLQDQKPPKSNLDIRTIETRASCIRLCLIDDCGDVDVPLAEFGFGSLCACYELSTINNVMMDVVSLPDEMDQSPELNQGSKAVTVEGSFTLDYYNRVLGGWEPFVEPWRCRAVWRPEELISTMSPSRHRIALHSDDVLDVNVTDALLGLARLVHESWMKDTAPKTTPRSPFVPYSLRNDTGCVLYFATVITEPDEPFRPFDEEVESDERLLKLSWSEVQPGDVVPFEYGSTRSKQRHKESHRMRAHQLAVRVYGWRTAAPVTVDRVGVYFRQAAPDRLAQPSYRVTALRPARLVFDVRLDGSARKLVTVRSALVLVNRLPDAIDVKLVERSAVNAVSTSSRTALLSSGETLPVPLIHAHSHIFIRPSDPNDSYSYSQPDVPWSRVTRPGERAHCSLRCTTNRGSAYYVCCEIRRERYPITSNASSIELQGSSIMMAIPAHSILLLPALLLVNLLPQDLYYNVTATCNDEPAGVVSKGRILPGRSAAVSSADPEASLDISVHVENFRCSSGISISSAIASNTIDGINEYSCRVRLEDTERRRLFLRSRVEPGRSARVRVTVTAPYWFINRTGLPLVFRQEGVGSDTAGQFEEHELARMVAPLLFSFADQDASPTVVARVGYKYGRGKAQWCQQFHLRRGIQVRRLRVSHDSGPDSVYVVGIEVRSARGRRRHQHTNIVTVSPRHQLHNRSKHTLEFAQSCHASTFTNPTATAAHVHAPPGCHVPFHWPRLDRDQLLCVRCTDSSQNFRLPTSWSGGLRIDSPLSCHVMLRDAATGIRTLFLHAEVVPHGAMYCVVFSDADSLPPPLRIDNCSDVAVTFAQQQIGTIAHAHRSVPYAWDEPTGAARLTIIAPGGVSASYDIDRLGRGIQLTYENFIYVAFTATFNTEDDLDHYDEADYSSVGWSNRKQIQPNSGLRLVLDVLEGSTIVVLAVKQPGKRSQLWRMTSTGQLQHEGSTAHEKSPFVLDIEQPAPQPSAPQPARLALRRPDPRRRTTQTWRFTADGRLCCAHRNTCVQAQGLFGLRAGMAAVLASMSTGSLPIEQAVGKQRMRPGSGLLAVELTTDGPTRVVRITDMKQNNMARAIADDEDWRGVAEAHRPTTTIVNNINYEVQLTVMLRAGLGVSVIGGGRELLYLQLNNIIAEIVCGPRNRELCVSVQDAQCDNQLMDTNECPILLHAARARNPTEARRAHSLPVLEIRAELQPAAGAVVIFKHLIICIRPIAIHLEETLLLRMYEFLLTAIGDTISDDDDTPSEGEDGDDEENVTGAAILSSLGGLTTGVTTRYHFGIIRLVPGPVRLSVHTASGSLPVKLRALKRRLGLTLVGFEDAPVELEPYVRHHPFETGEHLRRSVLNHFRDELLWQSAAILGSVDFLGSPLGLLGDVTEGVSGLIRERSVGALVLNVAHGLSNSAAKMTETLGDGLGRVTMDDAHEEMRQRIRRKHAGSGGEHLVAGIKGLGFGLLGGATGIFKQVYEGAANDGLQGVFSGLGKGLVGVVAKPVVGVLDLATETARAVRDSSRGTGRNVPERRRQPRATIGPGGLLPPYNPRDSRGQAYLRTLNSSSSNDRDSDGSGGNPLGMEQYVAYECVRSGADDLRVIVSSERVRVVTAANSGDSLTIVTETGLGELMCCMPVTQENKHYIEMTVRGGSALRRPRIRCDTEELARAVTRQVNYAKRLHEEAAHTLHTQDD